MRILGVDFGDARTGLAISDPTGFLACAVRTLEERNFDRAAEMVCEEARRQRAEKIVVGHPRNMDGSLGPRAEKCAQFAKAVEQNFDGSVILWDERSTTVSAHRFLNETNTRGKKRKAAVDQVAATIILQSYLDSLKFKKNAE